MNSKKRILLVDDDQVSNFLTERIINEMGIAREVYSATNGKEALAFFDGGNTSQHEMPDLVLLDLNMPIMSGFDFIEAFQKLDFDGKENVMIIVVTSSNNSSDIERAKSLGIKHYLVKPISLESVQEIIGEG